MKQIIGRSDIVDLPDLDLFDIEAKVDTGARTSAINCHDVEEKVINGKKYIEFYLLDPEHPAFNDKVIRVSDYTTRTVKNSFGQAEERYVFATKILLFGQEIKTQFTLSNRSDLKFSILLGRRLLAKRFLVDVSQKNLSFNQKNK